MAPKTKKGKRRGMKRQRKLQRKSGVPEWASLTEVMTLRTPGPVQVDTYVTNVMNQLYNINLGLFARARLVGQAYREFRIKQVKLTFKPLQDTFAPGTTAVPYLYYLIDKTGSYQNITTTEQMKRMGAVGRRLDERDLIATYRPSVLTKTYDNNDGPTQFNQYRISPWLSTNDNAPSGIGPWQSSGVDHLGIKWVVQQDGGTIAYRVEMQVEFEFRKALINETITNPLPVQDVFPDDTPNTVEDLQGPLPPFVP